MALSFFGRFTSRIDELRKVLTKDPASRQFLALADEYRKEGKLREAIETLEKGLSYNPSSVAGHVALGRLLVQSGQLDDALLSFQAALRLDRENLVAIRQIAEVHLKKGDKVEGVKKLKLYRGLNPGDREVGDLITRLDEEIGFVRPKAPPVQAVARPVPMPPATSVGALGPAQGSPAGPPPTVILSREGIGSQAGAAPRLAPPPDFSGHVYPEPSGLGQTQPAAAGAGDQVSPLELFEAEAAAGVGRELPAADVAPGLPLSAPPVQPPVSPPVRKVTRGPELLELTFDSSRKGSKVPAQPQPAPPERPPQPPSDHALVFTEEEFPLGPGPATVAAGPGPEALPLPLPVPVPPSPLNEDLDAFVLAGAGAPAPELAIEPPIVELIPAEAVGPASAGAATEPQPGPGEPLVTETLANLYASQGYLEEAHQAYASLAAAETDDARARLLSGKADEVARRLREEAPVRRLRRWGEAVSGAVAEESADLEVVLDELVGRLEGATATVTDFEGLPVVARGPEVGSSGMEGLSAELTAFWKNVRRTRSERGEGGLDALALAGPSGVVVVQGITDSYALLLKAGAAWTAGRVRFEALRGAERLRPALL